MGKRLIITEEEKNEIFSKYQVIEEQLSNGFTISSIKDVKYPDMVKKTYKIAIIKGKITINGVTGNVGDTIKPTDKLTMTNNAIVHFTNIPNYGQVVLSYINSTPYLRIYTD